MTDTPETVAVPTIPVAPPKSTTPDDLLEMYDEEVQAAKEEVTEAAEKEIQVKEEVPKLEMAKALAEEVKTLPPKEETEKTEETPAEEKPEFAKYKAKFQDSDLDIPEEAEVKVKVNNKEVPVKIRDAVTAWTKQEDFNRKMDQRISYISNREKKWETDQSAFKGNISKVIETVRGGDFVTGIRALAKLATSGAGLEQAAEFERKYFEQLDKVHDLYSKMSPAERDKFFAERKAKDLEEELKRREQERSAEEQRSALQSKVKSLQDTHQIPDGEFWESYTALIEKQVGEGKAFASRDDITPEDVAKYVLAVRHESKVYEAAQKLGVEDEALLDKVSKITATDPKITVEKIVEVIQKSGVIKTAPPNVVENLNRKAKAHNAQSSQVSSAKKQNGKISGLSEEDLEFLYRQQPRSYKPAFR